MKKVVVITLVLFFVCVTAGCKKSGIVFTDLKNALPFLTTEKIAEISFCSRDANGVCIVFLVFPQSAFAKTVQLMKLAEPYYAYVGEHTCFRIVTDKRTLYIKAECHDDEVMFQFDSAAFSSSSASLALRKYFKELGWKEPMEPNAPIGFKPNYSMPGK